VPALAVTSCTGTASTQCRRSAVHQVQHCGARMTPTGTRGVPANAAGVSAGIAANEAALPNLPSQRASLRPLAGAFTGDCPAASADWVRCEGSTTVTRRAWKKQGHRGLAGFGGAVVTRRQVRTHLVVPMRE